VIKVALRGLLGRKLRTALTALAIVLGVAMVSGTYILTDTINKGFTTIFTQSYKNTSAVITARSAISNSTSNAALRWLSGLGPHEGAGAAGWAAALAIDPRTPSTLYAATSSGDITVIAGGIFRSVDAGATWRPFNQGLRPRDVNALAIASTGNPLYAGTRGGGVLDYRFSG